jgi:hypothetical protein
MESTSGVPIDSLVGDLERLRYQVILPRLEEWTDRKERALSICRQMREKQAKKAGYPRLYLLGWDVLVDSLRLGNDYSTLKIIGGIYKRLVKDSEVGLEGIEGISLWHLKTVLYCWAYMKNSDSTVSTPRKLVTEATTLLDCVSSSGAFINMTPDDAILKILGSQNSLEVRPYLFRISTTNPGSMSITFLTPVTNQIAHMRIDRPDDVMIILDRGEGSFYSSLWSYLSRGKTYINRIEAAFTMHQLDNRMDNKVINTFLSSLYSQTELKDSQEVFTTLLKKFFSRITPLYIPSQILQDRLGLTPTYKNSYTLSGNITCFQCSSFNTLIREPVNNSIYCTDQCYRKDWVKCY